MVTKELSEVAVEFNCILEYTSEELKRKIPKKFLSFLKDIQSQTYKFEYDKNKKLNEQKLKPETRGLIALVYQNYICDENEKKEYLQKSQEIIKQKENEKRNLYNPDEIFKRRNVENDVNISDDHSNVAMIQYKESFFTRIIKKLKNIFLK